MLTNPPGRFQVSSPASRLNFSPFYIMSRSLVVAKPARDSLKGIKSVRSPKISWMRTKTQASDNDSEVTGEMEGQKDEAANQNVNTIDDWNILEAGQDGAHPILHFLSGNLIFVGALGVAALLAWLFAGSVRSGRNQSLRVQSRYPEAASMRGAYGYPQESSHGRYESQDIRRHDLERRIYNDRVILPREESYGEMNARQRMPTEVAPVEKQDEEFGHFGSNLSPYSDIEVKTENNIKREVPDEDAELGIGGPVSTTGHQMNKGYSEEWEETYLSDDDIPRGMSIQEMKSRAELAGKTAVKAMAHAQNAAVSASIAATATKQAQEAAQKAAQAAAKCQHALELRSYEQMQTAYQATKQAEEAAQIYAQKSAIMASKSVMEESKTRKKAQTAEICQDFSKPHGIVNIMKSSYSDATKKMAEISIAVKEGGIMAVTAVKHGGQAALESAGSALNLAKGIVQKSKGNA